ncbi:cell envelope biogenesis protein TolA [Variovorax sp. J22R133]|uniref:cell envelope biogenesis protein TolA n=1 Tax=Variovorax brevis TaxID=3053503 RepID=UPI002575538D|nr:cell envelope biogenesis protein TolA [Variovorax sp. J22R133]MDM0112431.1 cell envelope biogenesis protein TolA [Variovorax sp. J22R133]
MTYLLPTGRRFETISNEEYVMSKVLAVMIAGLFAVGAYAQNPAGQSSEQGNVTNKATERADAKKASKPAGQVKGPGGDAPLSTESAVTSSDKAAASGEARKQTRDQRRPGKRKTTQGGTPDMPGAK